MKQLVVSLIGALGIGLMGYAQEVGIGTTTPVARLHIDAPAGYTSDLIRGIFNSKSYFIVDDQGNLVSAVEATDASASPGAPPVSGDGRRMLWYSEKAAFRAGYVNGTQWDQANIGNYSAALGDNSTVSGMSGFAAGTGHTVSGDNGMALGSGNIINDDNGTAIGINNQVSGVGSIAMGAHDTTNGHFLSIGSSTLGFDNHTTRSGSIAIGNKNYTYHNGSFLTSAHYSNLDAAIAIGTQCTVSTARSIAMGFRASVKNFPGWGQADAGHGLEVIAIGSDVEAAGYQSVIIGKGAYGDKDAAGAVVLGYTAKVYGNKGTAVGFEAEAHGSKALAISTAASRAYGDNSAAIGYYARTETTAPRAIAIGNHAKAWGEDGAAIGLGVESKAMQVVVGTYNQVLGSNSGWVATEPVFIVGNGQSFSHSNAMVVLKNGNVGFGTNTPARTVHINDVLRLEPRATAPASPSAGDIYFDSGTNKLRCYDGTNWQDLW